MRRWVVGLLVGLGLAAVMRSSRQEVRTAVRRATEDAALRRVATSVARGASADEVTRRSADEIGRVLGAAAVVVRFDADGATTVVARSAHRPGAVAVGTRSEPDPRSPHAEVRRTRRPVRHDGSVAVPVVVGGKVWGILDAGTPGDGLPPRVEGWLEDIAGLVALSITNEENRTELVASRARLLAATHETRRSIEEDLQSGPKQDLVSVLLRLRMIQESVPDDPTRLQLSIGAAADELSTVLDELRSITRRLHPPILEIGGLAAALAALVRRSSIPVDLHIDVNGGFPPPVEVTAYYLVDEAITNAAKRGTATRLHVSLRERDDDLAIAVRDDGDADQQAGPDLVGMRDLTDALGGVIEVIRPPGAGTEVRITLPGKAGMGQPSPDGRVAASAR